VLTTIHFDDQLRFAAYEIDDEGADQRLATKMRAGDRNVMTQASPEHTLRICRLRSHIASELTLAIAHRR
jgi:hypothetical protein